MTGAVAVEMHPLRAGWLPETELDWLEGLRVEHELLVAARDRLAAAAAGFEERCAAVEAEYRRVVRGAVERAGRAPLPPAVLIVEAREIEREETAAAAEEAARAVFEFARSTVGVLLERRGELEEAGEPVRGLLEQVSEPGRRREERAVLLEDCRRARAALEDLRAAHRAEDEAVWARRGRIERGEELPPGWEPGDPVVPPELPYPAERRPALEEARAAVEAAEGAVRSFDAGQGCGERPLLVRLGLVAA